MEKFLESKKNIYNYFENMLYEHYESESQCKNVHIVDIFPKIIDSEKYFDFEETIIKKNKCSILNKFILSMLKIYMYDDEVYRYVETQETKNKNNTIYFKQHEEYVEYICIYDKNVEEFLLELKSALQSDSEKINLFFYNLKIGFIIGDGYITYSNFGNNKLFIDELFKSEGLFIRN